MNDFKFAFRQLLRNPGFTAVAVVTLALGIGANTAIFSVVNAVLLKPLPYYEPDRIMTIWTDNPTYNLGFHELPPSQHDLIDWRSQANSFEQIAAVSSATIDLNRGDNSQRVGTVSVTANLFSTLGVQPMIGRVFTAEEEQPGFVLLGSVAFVLLIACANVANLLLSRSAARRKEMAIRAAIGAGRARVIKLLLTESMVLAVLGGLAGLLLGIGGLKALLVLSPPGIPRLHEAAFNGWVFAYSIVVTLATGVVFGFAPAWTASKVNLSEVLNAAGRGNSGGGRARSFSRLVAAETAIAVILLVGATLMLTLVGLYGVVAYGASQRTRELGIRMALGAQRFDLLALVIGQGMRPALAGLACGIAGAFGLTRFLTSQLYEISPTDPATLIGVSLVLAIVAILACWLPARRVTQLDPTFALRAD